jgi:hypothetical protein
MGKAIFITAPFILAFSLVSAGPITYQDKPDKQCHHKIIKSDCIYKSETYTEGATIKSEKALFLNPNKV